MRADDSRADHYQGCLPAHADDRAGVRCRNVLALLPGRPAAETDDIPRVHLSPFSQCRSSCVSNLPQRSTCPMKRALVLPISLGVLAAACAVLWPACRLQMHVHSFVCCSACGGQSCSARQLRASELARNQLAPSTSFRRTAAAGRRRRIGWKHKTQLLDCAGVWRPTATPRQAARRCLA